MNRVGKIILWVVLAAVLLSGCEPLRKKFIRQKKKGAEDSSVTPILEPYVYPEKAFDPTREYKHHYNMWGVWYKEFVIALEEKASEKRQRYLLSQMMAQLEGMDQLLTDEKRMELKELRNGLQELLDRFNTPSLMREGTQIKRNVMTLDRRLRENFRLKDVEKNLRR